MIFQNYKKQRNLKNRHKNRRSKSIQIGSNKREKQVLKRQGKYSTAEESMDEVKKFRFFYFFSSHVL